MGVLQTSESGMKISVSYFHVYCAVALFLIQFNALNVRIWYVRHVLILTFLIKKEIDMMKNLINVLNDVGLKSSIYNHQNLNKKY